MESKIASAAWVTAPGQWEPGALRWVFYDCNVLGDPAMAVFTDNPIAVNASFPANVDIAESQMTVSVTSSGSPAPGLTCVALKDGIMLGKSVTDKSGNAVVVFDRLTENPGEAKLVVSGYNCVPATNAFNVVVYNAVSTFTEDQSDMAISPNPANRLVTVEANLKIKSDYILKVYNIEGKLILADDKNSTDINGRINKNIDISKLKAGQYTCEIRSGNKKVSKHFIVY